MLDTLPHTHFYNQFRNHTYPCLKKQLLFMVFCLLSPCSVLSFACYYLFTVIAASIKAYSKLSRVFTLKAWSERWLCLRRESPWKKQHDEMYLPIVEINHHPLQAALTITGVGTDCDGVI